MSTLGSFVTSESGMTWLLACALKAALLLAASWVGAAVLRRSTAAARHQIWMLGVIGAVVLPLLCTLVPSLAPSETAPIAGTSSLVASAVVVTAGAATRAMPTWPAWIAIVWAVGTLVVATRIVHGHLAARRLVRAASPSVGEAWSTALRGADGFGLATRVTLLRSEAIGSPMTIGVLRPCVLLPAAADAWSPERLRAVLVHELGHVGRRDLVVQLAAQLACALYWWNPLAWRAAAQLRIEREHACDDLVLDAGILPSSYAGDLLDVARSISLDARAAACMVDRSWTETRLRRVLDATVARAPLRARFRLTACGLALAGAGLLACTSSSPVLPLSQSAATSRGTLSVGSPFLRDPYPYGAPVNHGAIDLSLVATEVNRRLAPLEECYARQLAAKPGLAGTVVIHWTITENGNVPESCITEDTVGDQAIADCVNALVRADGFPAPRGGAVDVSFPFVFDARAKLANR